MKRACVLGLLLVAGMALAGCRSGTTEMAGFSEDEGVWFDANGVRVHHERIIACESMHVQNSHGSTILLATDVRDTPCPKPCCEQLGSRSQSPRSSGYTRSR